MVLGPQGKKDLQLFDESRVDLGGDFTGLTPGPSQPLSTQAIPGMEYMATPPAQEMAPLPGPLPEQRQAPAPRPPPPEPSLDIEYPAEQGVSGYEREQEEEERRRKAQWEQIEDLAIREMQEEVAQDERKSGEFAQFYDRFNYFVRTPKGQVNLADLHDPGRVPVEHLAYAASIFSKHKLLPSEREASDFMLASYDWKPVRSYGEPALEGGSPFRELWADEAPQLPGYPAEDEPGFAPTPNQARENLSNARLSVRDLYEKYPERKEQYNRTIYERMKQRVNELKKPVGAIETPEGQALSKKRRTELKQLQPFFRVLDDEFRELARTKKTLIEQSNAGPVAGLEPRAAGYSCW